LFKVNREKVRLSDSPYAPPPEWYEELDPEREQDGSASAAAEEWPEPYGDLPEEPDSVPADLVEAAREQAGAMIAEAEAEAARLLEEARAQVDEIRQKAYSEGFLEGHIEGDKKASEEFEAIATENKAAVGRVLAEFFTAREAALNEFKGMKDEIKPIIFEIVKKIINVSYENDDKSFESLIKNALERIKPEGKLTLTVSEADYERFFPSGNAVFNVNGEDIPVAVVKNASLGLAELIIDAGDVTVNAGPDTQLRRIRSAFDRVGTL
jgi:flagellar biosynthesis/type III secretory pathway protein FliH